MKKMKIYNKNYLYILRNSDYTDVKKLINKINNCKVNVGIGSGQKK